MTRGFSQTTRAERAAWPAFRITLVEMVNGHERTHVRLIARPDLAAAQQAARELYPANDTGYGLFWTKQLSLTVEPTDEPVP